MGNKLKVAVVGVGALGRHHARILSGMPDVELIAVCDPNQTQGEQVAAACNTVWTADYRTLLSELDAASIVVPTCLHARIAQDFLAADVPLLVEKPLAADLTEARAMANAAAERNLVLHVGHVERFNPAFRELQSSAASPTYLRAERVSPFAFRSTDIGVVHDLMIHDLDLILAFLKSHDRSTKVDAVDAFGAAVMGTTEDTAQARLHFEDGLIADLTASRVCPAASRTFRTWSASGWSEADLHSRKVTHFTPTAAIASEQPVAQAAAGVDVQQLKDDVFGRYINVASHEGDDTDALTAELSRFLMEVRGDQIDSAAAEPAHADDAIAALELAERVLSAIAATPGAGQRNAA